ncbi:MAG: transcription antitermination factor NusB [Hyphomonadaceae bacterium]|nr:transcription antitermination factor NusB [Hyphomonadaceae bacterium]
MRERAAKERSGRRAARLAAVQGLYQMEVSGASTGEVAEDFRAGRLPRGDSGPFEEEPEPELFKTLLDGAVERQEAVDRAIAARLKGWKLERIDSVARAILRAGVVELEQTRTPTPIVIDEYVEIAKAFFDGPEPGFVNAALDACAKDLRPDTIEP